MTSNNSSEAQDLQAQPRATPDSSKPTAVEPYSIFDRRQKGLVVAIASIAATCEFTSPTTSPTKD